MPHDNLTYYSYLLLSHQTKLSYQVYIARSPFQNEAISICLNIANFETNLNHLKSVNYTIKLISKRFFLFSLVEQMFTLLNVIDFV